MRFLKNKKISSVFILFLLFCFGNISEAAVLQLKPSISEVSVGNIFSIQVSVNTLGKFINNAESVVQYPKDLLEVVSVDKSSSIFSLWVGEPSFSNSTGQITFNGGVPNPGFNGANGSVVSVIFRAKKVGNASIIFSNSAVRENDGLGTNILSGSVGSEVVIVEPKIIEQPKIEPKLEAPIKPIEKTETPQDLETIEPLQPRELNIDLYTSKIKVNESMEISGTAPYQYASIKLYIKDGEGIVAEHNIKSNSYYQFSFISQPILKQGKYTVWLETLVDDGKVTLSSQKINILVEKPLILEVGSYTIGLMKVLIPAVILLIIFILLVMYGWYKFFSLYRKVRKESLEAEKVLSKSFDILHSDLREYIQKLRKAEFKRKLTKEEIHFLEKFDSDMSDAEDIISKEIKDVSRK